jgi:hypothetical protein
MWSWDAAEGITPEITSPEDRPWNPIAVVVGKYGCAGYMITGCASI